MRFFVVLVSCLCLTGCALLPKLPKITTGKATVVGPPDAGKPATVDQGETKTTFEVPEMTTLRTTTVASTPATETSAFVPDRTITEWVFPKPTRFEQISSSLQASTGTIDTSVAKHRIDAEQRIWLLWTAIACGIGGLIVKSLLPAWPALSNGLLIAAPCAFAAWKFSEVPAWLWLTVIVAVLLLVAGYKRAEWDKNNDGIPDFLQKK